MALTVASHWSSQNVSKITRRRRTYLGVCIVKDDETIHLQFFNLYNKKLVSVLKLLSTFIFSCWNNELKNCKLEYFVTSLFIFKVFVKKTSNEIIDIKLQLKLTYN